MRPACSVEPVGLAESGWSRVRGAAADVAFSFEQHHQRVDPASHGCRSAKVSLFPRQATAASRSPLSAVTVEPVGPAVAAKEGLRRSQNCTELRMCACQSTPGARRSLKVAKYTFTQTPLVTYRQ